MKVAGIDVHKKVLMVVVVDASAPEEKPARRRFVTMPSELHRVLMWLREQGVEEAVMESTAQYWRSVWLELEPHMRLHLAQAFSNRAPRGRKHDFKDAERLVPINGQRADFKFCAQRSRPPFTCRISLRDTSYRTYNF
jgi:transposase